MRSMIILSLLLIGILLAANTQRAEAQDEEPPFPPYPPTFCIRADGTIYPPTTLLATTNNITYHFTNNVADADDGAHITIERDNIVIDGTGFYIHLAAIDLLHRTNITLKGLGINDHYSSIYGA